MNNRGHDSVPADGADEHADHESRGEHAIEPEFSGEHAPDAAASDTADPAAPPADAEHLVDTDPDVPDVTKHSPNEFDDVSDATVPRAWIDAAVLRPAPGTAVSGPASHADIPTFVPGVSPSAPASAAPHELRTDDHLFADAFSSTTPTGVRPSAPDHALADAFSSTTPMGRGIRTDAVEAAEPDAEPVDDPDALRTDIAPQRRGKRRPNRYVNYPTAPPEEPELDETFSGTLSTTRFSRFFLERTLPASVRANPVKRRRAIIGGSALLLLFLVVLGGAITATVINNARSPQALASQYLQHIANGDADAANDMVSPGGTTNGPDFLTASVLGAATEHITEPRIVSTTTRPTGDVAVEVAYQLGGNPERATLIAEPRGTELLVLSNWELVTPLVNTVNLTVSVQGGVLLGGTAVVFTPNEGGVPAAAVDLFPALYPLASGSPQYIALDQSEARAVAGSDEPLAVTGHGLAELDTAVQTQVNALIDTCVAQTTAQPSGCPFRVFVFGGGAVSWGLSAYPTVAVSANGANFTARAGAVVANYSDPRPRTDTVSMNFDGVVTIAGDIVKIALK